MIKTIFPLSFICLSCGTEATKPAATQTGRDTAVSVTTDSGDTQGVVDTEDTEDVVDTAGAPSTPVNLLLNPGFENGEDGWSVWGGAQIVESNAHDGRFALQAGTSNGAEQRVANLEPNTTYRLTGWVKTDDPNETITMGVKDHGHPETKVGVASEMYVELDLEFTTGFGSDTATVYAYKHGGTSVGYADDVSLVEVGPGTASLVWSDEFDGSGSPDPTKWGFEEGFVRNEELQWYQSGNAVQEDGFLVIEGREESRPNPNFVPNSNDWRTNRQNIEYTSSSIRTKDLYDWRYGRLVVRAKVTNLTGTWPAIWTLGVDCPWPSNGEVDVMENYGGNVLANFAWGTNQQWSPQWDSSATPVSDFDSDWPERFHVWELDWTEQRMAIYLDGELLNAVNLADTINGPAQCEGQNPFQQNHYLLLNLALGSNGGSVDSLSFPTRYVVDYVRLYQ